MNVRMLLYSFVLGAELFVILRLYVGGPHGVVALRKLQRECTAVRDSCRELGEKIAILKNEIYDWNHDPAYKEIYARNLLRMGGDQELWYRY